MLLFNITFSEIRIYSKMLKGEPGLFISYLSLIALNTLNFVTHIPPNFQVLMQTPLIVYIGCIHSLRLYEKNVNVKEEGIETMTKKDALMFPVIGSCTLGGLFLAFTYLNKDYINIVFHIYFSFIGVVVTTVFFYNRFKDFFEELSKKVVFSIPKIPFLTDEPSPIDALYLILFLFSSVIGVGYYMTKHYYLNNLLGIFFSIVGIENMMLGATNIGFILLSLLFFYDIYWVFFTPVMVTVAKNLEGPIKLMFPKKFDWEDQKDFNMIGLGDIVIPGIYVALMLRYDYLRVLKKAIEKGEKLLQDKNGNSILPFGMSTFGTYLWCFMGYFMGILTTLFIMNVFQHAQPALLYLVPGVLIGSTLPALFRGEFMNFFNFEENKLLAECGIREEEKEEDKKEEDNKNKKE